MGRPLLSSLVFAIALLAAPAAFAQTCNPGFYGLGGTEPCAPCPAGTSCSAPGCSSCLDCSSGTFQPNIGSSSCFPCPGGEATPCNDNGVCSDGPTGTGTCSCFVGYTGPACENGPPTTTTTSTTTTTTTSTSTTSTTLVDGCGPTIETGCLTAAKSSLTILASGDPAKRKLKWRWSAGQAFEQGLIGVPTGATDYVLCLYDTDAGVPTFASSVSVEASMAWTNKAPKGWLYKDATAQQDGVKLLSLVPGAATKTRVKLMAAGDSLPLPTPVGDQLFAQETSVIAQLLAREDDATVGCWTSQFDVTVTKSNAASVFKASVK